MFKPTAPQYSRVRLRLTTKAVNKGYYKGNRTGSMGAHTPHGRYIIDYRKVRTYVCPQAAELANFKLTPFVTNEMEPTKFFRPTRSEETGDLIDVEVKAAEGYNGQDYLREWEEQNQQEAQELSARSDAPESSEEYVDDASVDFTQNWEDLPETTQQLFKNQKEWERQKKAYEWYKEVEARTTGIGLGGSARRKIRA